MAALEQISINNHNKYNNGGGDSLPVKAGFFNRVITLLSTLMTELGVITVDSITERTSGAGVNVDGVLLKVNVVQSDTITEKTAGSGVTLESVLVKDGKVGAVTAITGNSTGGNSAIISAVEQHVVLTFSNVDHIVSLPLLASFATGAIIRGATSSTGGELRVHPTNQVVGVTINGVTGGNELKLNQGTAAYFEAIKTSTAKWIVKTYSSLGAPTTIVPNK